MKKQLIVILVLLLIIICYYWLTQYNKSIETYVNNVPKVYIHNVDNDGNVKIVLDQTNIVEAMHIKTFEGHDVEVVIGEGIEEINGFFTNDLLLLMKNHITKVLFPSTLKKIGPDEFKDYSKLTDVILPANVNISTAFQDIVGINITFTKSITIIPSRESWNHVGNIRSWASERPFLVYNAINNNPTRDDHFENKWVIVYKNEYYPISNVPAAVKCSAIDLGRYKKYKTVLTLNGYKTTYRHVNYTCNDYSLDTGTLKNGERNGNEFSGSIVNNDSLTDKYMVNTTYPIKEIESITSEILRDIRTAYRNNLYPLSEGVQLQSTQDEFIVQEITEPKTIYINNLENYIESTENDQIANIKTTNDNDLYNVQRAGALTKEYMNDSVYSDYTEQSVIYIEEPVGSGGVTSLGPGLFKGHSNLKTIVIPTSVLRIENNCFESCTNLENVFFYPNSQLTSIGDHAFANCTSLKIIHLPDGLLNIGLNAFVGCYKLQVYINPTSALKIIEMNAFESNINLLMLPLTTHFVPLKDNSIKMNDLFIKAKINSVNSIENTTIQSRYITQSVIEDDGIDFYGMNYEVETIGDYYFYSFYPPQNKDSDQEYNNIRFVSSKGDNQSIKIQILCVGGGGSGAQSSMFDWDEIVDAATYDSKIIFGTEHKKYHKIKVDRDGPAAGGGGGGEVQTYTFDNFNHTNPISMKVGHGGFWGVKNNHMNNDGDEGEGTWITIHNVIQLRSNPGQGGKWGGSFWHERSVGGKSGSNKEGGTRAEKEKSQLDKYRYGIYADNNDGGGGGGGGSVGNGYNQTKKGGNGGEGYTWIDGKGYGGGGGGGGWQGNGGGTNEFGGGTGGDGNDATDGIRGGGGGGGSYNDRQNLQQIDSGWKNRDGTPRLYGKYIPFFKGKGGEGVCVLAFKKQDFDNGGWKMKLNDNDNNTVQKQYNVYQNKVTNKVLITNNINNLPKSEVLNKYFITVPFPIDYYRTFDTNSSVITNQLENINKIITGIRNAEVLIEAQIQNAISGINTINNHKTALINSMNLAYPMNELQAIQNDFDTDIINIESFLAEANNLLSTFNHEINKQAFNDRIETETTRKNDLITEIKETVFEENKIRIEKRIIHENALEAAEIKHNGVLTKLKEAARDKNGAPKAWFEQYKSNNNIDELENNIDFSEKEIDIYNNDVKTNEPLNSLKKDLNDLNKVYDQVVDHKQAKILEKKQYKSYFDDITREQENREIELKEKEEERKNIIQENQNIKLQGVGKEVNQIMELNQMDLQYTTDKMNEQILHTKNMIQLGQQKNIKTQLFNHVTNEGEKIVENQGELIVDTIQKQKQYEPFMNINRDYLKYMEPKFEDYKLNQEDCNHLLTTFDAERCNEEEYYTKNKDKCIQKEVCENRNHNNQLENEIYIKPGTKKRFKDSKENYHYNYSNAVHMSLGILTLLTIIYKIK